MKGGILYSNSSNIMIEGSEFLDNSTTMNDGGELYTNFITIGASVFHIL